jgi:hypothetical protein
MGTGELIGQTSFQVNSPSTSAVPAAASTTIHASGHAFVDGNIVTISSVGGMTRLNADWCVAGAVAGATFQLMDAATCTIPLDSSSFTAWIATTGTVAIGAGTSVSLSGTGVVSVAQVLLSGTPLDSTAFSAYVSGGTVTLPNIFSLKDEADAAYIDTSAFKAFDALVGSAALGVICTPGTTCVGIAEQISGSVNKFKIRHPNAPVSPSPAYSALDLADAYPDKPVDSSSWGTYTSGGKANYHGQSFKVTSTDTRAFKVQNIQGSTCTISSVAGQPCTLVTANGHGKLPIYARIRSAPPRPPLRSGHLH